MTRWLLLAGLLGTPAAAEAPRLVLPLDCDPGTGCYVQHHMDRDPGPGVADYACGSASYDGHDGTDFAVPTLAAMRAGVAVRAAASGQIAAVRDGEPDGAFLAGADLAGKDCGNGVVIDHADGWQSQYCHLAQGSVLAQPGQTVAAGAPIGLIGLSGKTEFPHLHLTLRQNGTPRDPFAPAGATTCPPDPAAQLWQTPVSYAPAGLLAAGLSIDPPDYAEVKAGLPQPGTLPAKAPQLIVWGYGWGSQTGDILVLSLEGPQGFSFHHDDRIERAQALFYRYAGQRIPGPAGWPQGRYTLTATLTRNGAELDRETLTLTVEN
jgi:hypothetical protein